MDRRKEIFEYLRNAQKAAEIEAKVHGINVWVILGAIAVVFWQLVGSSQSSFWQKPALVSSTFLMSAAAFFFGTGFFSRTRWNHDTRYLEWGNAETEAPYLEFIRGLLTLAPVAYTWFLLGFSWSALCIGILGVVYLVVSVRCILSNVLGEADSKESLPSPHFRSTPRAGAISELIFGISLGAVIIYEGTSLVRGLMELPSGDAKTAILLGGVYWLVMLAFRQRVRSNRIAWTYELETELLIDAVTPDIALRKIEHRALGPRLEDVLNRFVEEIDEKFRAADEEVLKCRAKLSDAKSLPPHHPAERRAWIDAAVLSTKGLLDGIDTECEKYAKYLKRLAEYNEKAKRPAISVLLPGLTARQVAYGERARKLRKELTKDIETVQNQAAAGTP